MKNTIIVIINQVGMWCCKRQAGKWEDQYVVKVEATVAAHIRKKRWEVDKLMELPADVLPSVDGTVLDPLPTQVKINTNEQIKKINKSNDVSLMSINLIELVQCHLFLKVLCKDWTFWT